MSGNGGFKKKIYTNDGWDRQVVPIEDAVTMGLLYLESKINFWLNQGYQLEKLGGGFAYFKKRIKSQID